MPALVRLFGVAACASTSLAAQMPAEARVLTPRAVTDSQSVLAELEARVRSNPRDAAAWHRRGMVAWCLADRARAENPPRELDATILGRIADTSLRIASDLAPDSARFHRWVGHYLLRSGNPTARHAAVSYFDKAVEAARRINDRGTLAKAALDAGLGHWLRYDNLSNRRQETTTGSIIRSYTEGAQVMQKLAMARAEPHIPPVLSMKSVVQNFLNGTRSLPQEINGDAYYHRAGELFQEAYAARADTEPAFRNVAMTFAERARWPELERFARQHLTRVPRDPLAYASVGLASHRQGRSSIAATYFDSALAHMSAAERMRFDAMKRVRPVADTSAIARGTPAQQQALQQLYWLLANPLWSNPANVARVEFLSRVTFAELRWTVDEVGVRGADTDRGNVYVRLGPPKVVGSFQPNMREGLGTPNGTEVTTVWIYENDLMFVFRGIGTFGTAETAPDDRRVVAQILEVNPVRWDNVTIPEIDTLPAQIARFRRGADSMDVVLAAEPDVARIAESAVASSAIQAHVWWMSPSSVPAYRDSLALPGPGVRAWTHPFARGTYVVRAEASAPEASRASQVTLVVDAGSPSDNTARGFGVSDLLLGSAITAEAGRRWRDVSIQPIATTLPRDATLAILWENYELASRDGTAQYQLSITLRRERSLAGRIAARVIGGLASAARVDRRGDDVVVTLDRTVPHAEAFADHITLSLQDTPPGRYQITVQITDRNSQRVATRSKLFTIRD